MVGGDGSSEGEAKIRRWGCNKNDFFPEESFRSWGNYGRALRDTRLRLQDRLLTRSSDDLELNQMCARSQNEMAKSLNWVDIIWFGVGGTMGAGVFVLTGQAAKDYAGPAVVISYLVSGLCALLSVLSYTEFAVELPVAGGSFAFLRVELGDFFAFLAAGNLLCEYIVAGASVARAWTSYFATLCNKKPDDFRIHASFLADGYNQLDPIAVVISITICICASLSTKGSSRFNSLATIAHIGVMLFIIIAGLTKADTSNYETFAPFGIHGVLKASAMLFFAFVGFDGVSTLAEEVKNPGRDIPIGLIGAMLVVITTYCLLAATLCLMQPYSQVDVDAPYTIAFEAVGLDWAKYIVAFGALKGMTTVLLSTIIGEARYFTHIARTHLAPPFLAVINEKTRTPVNATIVMTVTNSLVAFFTGLDVLANLLSISTLFIFSQVSIALLVRRYYVSGETSNYDRNKLVAFLTLIIASAIGLAIIWVHSKSFVAYVVMVAIWFMSTLGLKLSVKEARKPRLWGVPCIPWLPSASVAINIFIMGSIDGPSFIRFSVWTGLLLMYYFLIGLHATYDAARETKKDPDAAQVANVEAGISPSAAPTAEVTNRA
ncbi:Cationic amino acid transporter 1 [Heracleum sosnowskyi]|uniref:Cationic amino acid transporter 1 n=1 Tax=Heracleum sosnowskyi TaxID=360622 RepID=A0AAD8MKM9_9APIA|nr:Cationic amino acid transporter 1 [Heracleum sosnowskyi]